MPSIGPIGGPTRERKQTKERWNARARDQMGLKLPALLLLFFTVFLLVVSLSLFSFDCVFDFNNNNWPADYTDSGNIPLMVSYPYAHQTTCTLIDFGCIICISFLPNLIELLCARKTQLNNAFLRWNLMRKRNEKGKTKTRHRDTHTDTKSTAAQRLQTAPLNWFYAKLSGWKRIILVLIDGIKWILPFTDGKTKKSNFVTPRMTRMVPDVPLSSLLPNDCNICKMKYGIFLWR